MINNKYLAEFVGTALLMMVITGSGIMGYDLSRGNAGIALLINCIATGIALFILITIFINVSGAHFNPLVTLVSWSDGEINNEVFVKYFLSQLMGALLGIIIAHIIFYLPIIQFSTKVSVKLLAIVNTGFTKKVDEVNKYPAVTNNETINGI